MSATIVMQEEKRGETSKKGPLRLPVIAPKDDHSSSASSSRSGQPGIPPRARLPPRSRTGCWTCRTRKVKCDEGRPVCGQCSRLGHVCDYSPRLSFRDDTPRVVERMQEVSIVGNSIWDSHSPAPTETSQGSVADDLPPFAQLLTDEERERKAERSSPGTYQVLVNPDSFAHLPEYSDDSDARKDRLSPLRRGSIATSLASSLGRESEGVPLLHDPNIVVLPRFEDVAKRVTSREPQSPSITRIKTEEEGDSEDRYLRQFKRVVWRQLVPAELGQLDGMDKSSVLHIEREAPFFPPLQHAIKAVAAFSLATDKDRVDALQHYQEAVSLLKDTLHSTEDLASDGSFLTHFLLTIHEIATAEESHWRQHLGTLLQISGLRRSIYGSERFPFIIWWLCMIDLEAIFSGAGAGEFVGTLFESDMIPPPSYHLYPLGVDGSSVVYGNELESLPVILQLDFEVTVLAVRLAMLSREFRDSLGDARIRQAQIYELQENFRELWAAPSVVLISQNSDRLPIRPKRLFEHAQTLYRACIIYSHTSMWSTQRLETPPEYDTEISVAAIQILTATARLLDHGLSDCRFLVFPTFMAGFACHDGGQKMLALELLERMEKDSVGRNTSATRRALERIYCHQNERFMTTGQSLDVDWLDVLQEEEIMIVNFGL